MVDLGGRDQVSGTDDRPDLVARAKERASECRKRARHLFLHSPTISLHLTGAAPPGSLDLENPSGSLQSGSCPVPLSP